MSNNGVPHRPGASSLGPGLFLGTESDLPTPSGLTPNTRSEAEAAFSFNAEQQTSSAAAVEPPPHDPSSPVLSSTIKHEPRRRPLAPPRSGSNNYLDALKENIAGKGLDGTPYDPVSGIGLGEEQDKGAPGKLDRNQSWNQEDMKRDLQQRLMSGDQGQGYDTTSVKK